ncbi:hypothetical protein [Umezawaea beigongshangensis]|uniref:hypothetical protein n=1 Tax=Umezawaea beigongshangensis TaxID=2780383 RepID=UPI0018F178DE|nr:hypothetical protein [Umezawaea beigongshangensis]
MPAMVLLASHITIDGNDLSDHCSKIEVTAEVDEKDVTTFASLGWKEVQGGIKSGSLGATFQQDTAAGEIDALMWPLLGEVVPFSVRLDNAAASATNPAYGGNLLVKKWSPIAGSVGDVATVDVEFPTSGAIVRTTA